MVENDIQRPRPFWSGVITFGLVALPVSLFPANRGKSWALKIVDTNGERLERVYFCEKEQKRLSFDELVRGYEIEKGQFLVVEDEELQSLAPEKTQEIDLQKFVALEQLDPVYFERGYFLVPDQGTSNAYRLLATIMEEEQRAGIATFVMREREYLVAIIAENGILRAETLRFADEIRSPQEVGLHELPQADPAVVSSFRKTMSKLTKKTFDRDMLADDYGRGLKQVVKKKLRKRRDVVTTAEADAPTQSNVIDLMQVLKERLQARGNESEPHDSGGSHARRSRASSAKTPEKKAGGPQSARKSLRTMSRKELYACAQDEGIAGRSAMRKEELIKALEQV
ncbi:non-homologous end joining protein Ku [Kineobactrum salinum]|uniref:Ku protein n=1 Tax=Kineobactrum salinum TaxID=2708301 RepID=A0A6C0TXR1_9GAMM|nr:Ku protein [Kineobactrum salinum]QIB64189.1 Ku protein [Kineobactrum salinum]